MGKIYGAYGSNMNLKQMSYRCPKAKVVGTGTLKDYRLIFRGINKGVANVEACDGRMVPIVLWDITPACEKALDLYEGYPKLYLKRVVEVKSSTGEKVKAMVYVMSKEYKELPAEPIKEYLGIIGQGYQDNKIPLRFLREAVAETLREASELGNSPIDFKKPR